MYPSTFPSPRPFLAPRLFQLQTFAVAAAGVLAAMLSAEPLGAQTSTSPEDPVEGLSQWLAPPVVPRGAIVLGMEGRNTAMQGIRRDGAFEPIGQGVFFIPSMEPDRFPELQATETRFRELMGDQAPSGWRLNLGATGGRIEADEQRVDFRVGYGVLDRVTVGVTIPTIRRRVMSSLRLAATGATVGANPTGTAAGQVAAFLSEAQAALGELAAHVQAVCNGNGDDPGDPERCAQGQELLDRASSFVAGLDAAYDEEVLFPLRDSPGAQGLLDRWAGLRLDLADWDVATPGSPPMAQGPLSHDAFQASFVDPVWGPEGFPTGAVDEFMELGDVEAHVVVRLLELGTSPDALRARASLVASARFPTGVPDSLQLVAPFHTPNGVSGAGARLVGDLLLPSRFAALAVVEGWWFGETEATILAPDPLRVLGEDAVARAPARWTPGSHLRMRFTPRFHVTPSLSLGLGWEMARKGNAEYRMTTELPSGPFAPESDGSTLHLLRGELRYHGSEGPVVDALPFPLDLVLAYEGPMASSGRVAPAERRVTAGIRVLRRR